MIERYLVIFFSLYLPCSAELPLCHMEGEQCNVEYYGNGDTNLLAALALPTVTECKEACTNTTECRVFTYYGPGSSPYKEMCFLFSECRETSKAEDCVTESLEDCSCSLARECLVTSENLYGMYGGVAELRCHYTSVMPVYSIKWYKNGKEFYRLEARSYEEFRFITQQLHYIKSIAAISRAKLIQ